MREIKFRAWNKVNEKIHEYGSDEACDLWEDGCDLMGMSFLSCQPNIIWMQYTGLKDKNGKEIYEGDILKITCNFELRQGIEIDKVVWWEEGAWCCNDWCLFELVSNSIKGEQEFEVIGNIYENPELLEGNTK